MRRRMRMQIPEITALVDPDRVVEMIENQVLAAGPSLLAALAIARFEDDPQKALEFLDAIDQPDLASIAALSLFDRLGATASPEFRRELLERAARAAADIEEPGQAASPARPDRRPMARPGRCRAAARRSSGRPRLWRRKPRQQPFPDPRDDLALALARVDLPAALKLLEGRVAAAVSARDDPHGIANRIAATNPAEARRLIGMIEESEAAVGPAGRLPPDGGEGPGGGPGSGGRGSRPDGRGPVAGGRGPGPGEVRPRRRRALLRESVERLAKVGDGRRSGPSPAVALARLLPLAVRIDPDRAPDDFGSPCRDARRCRPFPSRRPW